MLDFAADVDLCDEEPETVTSPADALPKKTNFYTLRKVVVTAVVGLCNLVDRARVREWFTVSNPPPPKLWQKKLNSLKSVFLHYTPRNQ